MYIYYLCSSAYLLFIKGQCLENSFFARLVFLSQQLIRGNSMFDLYLADARWNYLQFKETPEIGSRFAGSSHLFDASLLPKDISSVPICYPAKPQQKECAWEHQREKTLLSLTLSGIVTRHKRHTMKLKKQIVWFASSKHYIGAATLLSHFRLHC